MRAILLAVAIALASAADNLGTITILEGQALIYRGSGRLHAGEGVRLAAGDIVETAASTFAQLELGDRSVAQLGPATRVMLNADAPRKKAERWLYVIGGWVKLSSVKRDAAAGPGFDLRGGLKSPPARPWWSCATRRPTSACSPKPASFEWPSARRAPAIPRR
jgi:hypothetical protein